VLAFVILPSDVIGLITLLLFTSAAWLFSGRHRVLLHWLLASMVGIAFAGLCVLVATGIARPWDGPLAALHNVVGILMLPVVASAAGLWLGANFSQQIGRPFPVPVLARLLFLLMLCFCCFSNTRTGYLGPSRLDPEGDWDNKLRFAIFHQVAVPAIIGLLLTFWLGRLLMKRPQPDTRVEKPGN
jgi:hypothetical protein